MRVSGVSILLHAALPPGGLSLKNGGFRMAKLFTWLLASKKEEAESD